MIILRELSFKFFCLSRKLVQYCVLKGYLRRVREYRVSLDESIYMNNNNNGYVNGTTDAVDASKAKAKKTLRELCDGTHDTDSLACLGHCMCRKHESIISFDSFILAFSSRPLPQARKQTQQPIASLDSYLILWK